MLSAILFFIILFVGLYLIALHPNTQRARMFRPFERQYIAHRGFFDNDENRPEIVRGLLSTNFFKDKPALGFFQKLFLTNLLFNFIATPDFIAYNHKHKNQFSYKLLRKLYRVKNAAWTIRSQQELTNAKTVFTCMIFDSFIPDKE